MARRVLRCLFCCVFAASALPGARAQSDPYVNMVGDWSGTITQATGGQLVKIPATLKLERDPKKPRLLLTMQFEQPKAPQSAPAAGGRRGFGGPTVDLDPVHDLLGSFTLELKPKNETMVRTAPHLEHDFKTTGLAKFAETGTGLFVATGVPTLADGGLRRWTVHVGAGALDWEIQTSLDGSTNWTPRADFEFRKTSDTTPPK